MMADELQLRQGADDLWGEERPARAAAALCAHHPIRPLLCVALVVRMRTWSLRATRSESSLDMTVTITSGLHDVPVSSEDEPTMLKRGDAPSSAGHWCHFLLWWGGEGARGLSFGSGAGCMTRGPLAISSRRGHQTTRPDGARRPEGALGRAIQTLSPSRSPPKVLNVPT